MSGPSLDHVGAMLGLAFLPDKLKLMTESTWFKAYIKIWLHLRNDVKAIFGPCQEIFSLASLQNQLEVCNPQDLSKHGLRPMYMESLSFGTMFEPSLA